MTETNWRYVLTEILPVDVVSIILQYSSVYVSPYLINSGTINRLRGCLGMVSMTYIDIENIIVTVRISDDKCEIYNILDKIIFVCLLYPSLSRDVINKLIECERCYILKESIIARLLGFEVKSPEYCSINHSFVIPKDEHDIEITNYVNLLYWNLWNLGINIYRLIHYDTSTIMVNDIRLAKEIIWSKHENKHEFKEIIDMYNYRINSTCKDDIDFTSFIEDKLVSLTEDSNGQKILRDYIERHDPILGLKTLPRCLIRRFLSESGKAIFDKTLEILKSS